MGWDRHPGLAGLARRRMRLGWRQGLPGIGSAPDRPVGRATGTKGCGLLYRWGRSEASQAGQTPVAGARLKRTTPAGHQRTTPAGLRRTTVAGSARTAVAMPRLTAAAKSLTSFVATQARRVMAGVGRAALAVAGVGRAALAVAGVGRAAPVVAGVGRAALVVAGVGVLAGCGLVGGPALLQGDAPDIITVTSPVVVRDAIPAKYTCHGGGVSPPMHWSGAPQDTKSLAVVIDDSDAPITPYIYWIVFDIGPSTTDIQQGQLPPGARQADNSAGQAVYDPPCPGNEEHSYRFTVYALHSPLSLPNGTSTKTAWAAIAHAAIARGRLSVNAES
jgi:Raf kinase inhibitor-like YbhB/YbcL family protein